MRRLDRQAARTVARIAARMADGDCFALHGCGIFGAVVLAAAGLAWFSRHATGAAGWRLIFAIPAALGFAVAIKRIWDFGWTGQGTPVPIAPPQKLVVVGFYRYVRNPMYVGFFAGWFSFVGAVWRRRVAGR